MTKKTGPNGLPHDSSHLHVSGKSEFVDDRALLAGELHLSLILSPYAHAEIQNISWKKIESDPDFAGIFLAKDFSHNLWGTIYRDQPLLAEKVVQFAGEPIAILAAYTRESALRLRNSVEVKFKVLPAIRSISEARKAKSFIGPSRSIERGNVKETFQKAPHQIQGTIQIAGADHFYLENQASIAYPLEDGQIEVHSSSQHPTETQHVVAHALGLPDKDVVCIVKRMGGAFGGKESQAAPFAAYAALVAHRLQRPARMVLSKDDDMIITGKRNPFENDYRVAFDEEGHILGLEVDLFSDGGAYADLSTSIMERAMLHCDNAYFIPHFRVSGQVCKTNFHPHTAFRGFGGPKGVATIERIIEEISYFLKRDPLEIRKKNCYGIAGDITPYGQKVENNMLPQLFERIEVQSDYQKRRKEVSLHNSGNPKILRGLSTTAVKFGISFTTRFLNQANALVIIHLDGTVQVSTGATEMGQGVNARIAEIVASELGLERNQVRIMPTRTDKNGNTSPTAASSGTDLNGAAALQATEKIKSRLSQLFLKVRDLPLERWATKTAGLGTEEEIRVDEAGSAQDNDFGVVFEDGQVFAKSKPSQKISFADLVREAYKNRISLSDYGYYRFPGLSFNKLTGEGHAFLYFTQGVATSEVSVNTVTGDVKVLRTDILMDLGRPVNEALDLGQVTGGFIQGMGWVTTEKLHYSKEGLLLTHAPSTYKIPNIQDTPRVFNAELIQNHGNHVNVRGTKAAGEPPLLLALSVWTAIQNALSYKFQEGYPRLNIPATQEAVLRGLYPKRFAALEST